MPDSGAGFILFDGGAGCDPDRMLDEVRGDGVDPQMIAALHPTHGHADHSAGIEPLRERVPKLRVVAGTRTVRALGAGDARLIRLDRARGRVCSQGYRWTPPRVDAVIGPGQPPHVGDLSLTYSGTPGYSGDHGSYLVGHADWSALICGNALFADDKVFLQDYVSRTITSIQAPRSLTFDRFLPGHGAFSLKDGQRYVAAALRYADIGVPPPQAF